MTKPAAAITALAMTAVACGLAVVVVLAAGGAVAAPGDVAVPEDGPAVELVVELEDDGTANWSVVSRFRTATPSQEAAFDDLVDGVDSGAIDPGYSAATFEGYLEDASGAVDREMAIGGGNWTAERGDTVSRLAFRVTWTGFANTTGEGLRVDDAFRSAEGTWLGTLTEGTRLRIVGPAGSTAVEAPDGATVDGRTVTLDGQRELAPGDLAVRYDDTSEGLLGPVPTWLAGLVAAGVLAVTAIGLAYRAGWRRSRSNGVQTGVGGGVAADTAGTDSVDMELLSDPERVEHLLERNGGRMKQAAIVEETGWSSAKVSQLLSDMDDEDRVRKLRIGQENLISLPAGDEVDEP